MSLDIFFSSKAAEAFKRISEAYEVLGGAGQSAYLAHVAASGGTSATSRRPAAEAPKDRQQPRPGPVWKPEEGGDSKATDRQKVGKSFNEVREAYQRRPSEAHRAKSNVKSV